MTASAALYDVLGVTATATPVAIKAAFRRQAKRTHPDHGGDARAFDEAKRAYAVLSDPERRAKYDATGEVDEPAIDATDSHALGLIGNMLMQCLCEDPDPLTHPIIASMREQLRKEKENLTKQILLGKRAQSRAEKMLKRFTKKTPGDNAFEGMLSWHLRTVTKKLAGLEQGKVINARAMEILSDYEFRQDLFVDALASMATFGFTTTSATGA